MAKTKPPVLPEGPAADHRVTRHALAMTAPGAPVARLELLAYRRHLRDLAAAPASGYVFSPAAADYALDFFKFLRHTKGEWAGQCVELDDDQVFVVGSLFGWLRLADGARRFRYCYREVPRKNGKSTEAAGIALLLAMADKEQGAEVYTAATKRDQARIVFEMAKAMAARSPEVRRKLRLETSKVLVPGSDSKIEPLSADASTLDGLNTHGAVLDELHAHKTRKVYDIIDTSMGARRQPLVYMITTAGEFSKTSICWEHHAYSEDVLEGRFADTAAAEWFAFIAGIDAGDDWQDEAVWYKANPALRSGRLQIDYLRRKAVKAVGVPAAQTAFRQKYLDEWVQSRERAIDIVKLWDPARGEARLDDFAGRRCYLGLDLGKVSDLSALAILFEPPADDGEWWCFCKFWCPEDDIRLRTDQHRVPYESWARQGFIAPTSGNATDFDVIKRDIVGGTMADGAIVVGLAERFDIVELAYDRTFAHELISGAGGLLDELGPDRVIPVGQGFITMGNATAAFLRALRRGKLRHAANPVLDWNAANLVMAKDAADNLKPDKLHSREKIDGIQALMNIYARVGLVTQKPKPQLTIGRRALREGRVLEEALA